MFLFLSLVIIVTAVSAGECPVSCDCRDFPRGNSLDGAFFTTVTCEGDLNITKHLPAATRRIILDHVLESDLIAFFDFISSDFTSNGLAPNGLAANGLPSKDLSSNGLTSKGLPSKGLPSEALTSNSLTSNDPTSNSFSNAFNSNTTHLPYFAQLAVRNSELTDLSNITFEGAEHLESLEFTNCQITIVPFQDVASNLSRLHTLDLSRNNLRRVEEESFKVFSSLEVLNLSANAIDSFTSDSFAQLVSLKCLDLTGNNLTVLDDAALRPLVSLQHLNLSKNRLEVLNEACFSSLLHLQQLDVSWNRLARVAPGSLELPSLARLMLAGNPRLGGSREPALLVGTGRRLQTVDASRTGLKQVPAALTHSIRTLRLAGNSIKLVKCGDVDSYPLLQLLDFTSNDLEEIEDDALGRLESLSVLYLTDNKLKAVPKTLPEKLRILHLEHNHIQQIQSGDLDGLPLLDVLFLSNNKIDVVKENSFNALGSLSTLDLSRNPITVLPPGSLTGPRELRVLKLSEIEIISPANDMTFPLSTPEHLLTLDLSKSPGLARQLLGDTATLAAARQLQDLNLSSTGLEEVRSDLLHYMPQLRHLQLYENPLNCTDIHWLAFWMRRQDQDEYRRVVCSSPPELWGTLLVDLQDIELERDDYQTTVQSINHTRSPTVAAGDAAPSGEGGGLKSPEKNEEKHGLVEEENRLGAEINGLNNERNVLNKEEARLNYSLLNNNTLNNNTLNNNTLNNNKLNNNKLNNNKLNNKKLNGNKLNENRLNDNKLNDNKLNDNKLNDNKLNDNKSNDNRLNDTKLNDNKLNENTLNKENKSNNENNKLNNEDSKLNEKPKLKPETYKLNDSDRGKLNSTLNNINTTKENSTSESGAHRRRLGLPDGIIAHNAPSELPAKLRTMIDGEVSAELNLITEDVTARSGEVPQQETPTPGTLAPSRNAETPEKYVGNTAKQMNETAEHVEDGRNEKTSETSEIINERTELTRNESAIRNGNTNVGHENKSFKNGSFENRSFENKSFENNSENKNDENNSENKNDENNSENKNDENNSENKNDENNSENKNDENKSFENTNSENKSFENKTSEKQNSKNKSTENKNDENKSSENKSAENKSSENKSAENKRAENKRAENKSAENKSAEIKSAENKNADIKSARNTNTAEIKSSGKKSSANKSEEDKRVADEDGEGATASEEENQSGSGVIAEISKGEGLLLNGIKSHLTGAGSENRTPTKNLSESGNAPRKPGGNNLSRETPNNLFIVSKGKPVNKKLEKPTTESLDRNMNEVYPNLKRITDVDGADKEGKIGKVESGAGGKPESSGGRRQHQPRRQEQQQRENVTLATGEMSMYSGEYKKESVTPHPGMLILAIGILGASAAVAMLTSRIARQRRLRIVARQEEDIEVSSLPSVTELW